MKNSVISFNEDKKLILKKIKLYRNELSKQLSFIHKIDLNTISWAHLLDSYLFYIISIIIIQKKKYDQGKSKKFNALKTFPILQNSKKKKKKTNIRNISFLIKELIKKKKYRNFH